MKHVTIILALILALASSVPAFAQESAAEWVKKLSSGSYAERERAAAMLVKIGPAALPALREASVRADLETRRRAILLIDRIEDEQQLIPTPIAVRFKNVAVREGSY